MPTMKVEILLINGWALGSVYALVAFGFVATYKTSKALNFSLPFLGATGALILASLLSDGAFGIKALKGRSPFPEMASHPVGWVVCFMLAMILVAGFGALVHRLTIRPLGNQSPVVITVATLAVSIPLQIFVSQAPISRRISMPWGTASFKIGDADVFISTLVVCAIAPIVLVAIEWFHRSRFGIATRAVAEDQEVALSVGINRSWVLAIGWGMAAMFAMVAALAFAVPPLGAGLFATGTMPALFYRAIPVLVIGGWDSYGGVYLAGIVIGMMQVMVGGLWGEYASFLGNGYSTVLPYLVMIIVLMIRPTGLFGQAAVRRV